MLEQTGKKILFQEGPGVSEMMEILGKQSTLKRIEMKKSRK